MSSTSKKESKITPKKVKPIVSKIKKTQRNTRKHQKLAREYISVEYREPKISKICLIERLILLLRWCMQNFR